MALDKEYLEYPHRSHGMDHERYDWSMLSERKAVAWPGDAKLALWINVGLQFFPLNQRGKPFAVPGGMTMPYPDLRHFSLRDYGNRVGIYRFLDAFDRFGIKPTFALNTELAERAPYLLETHDKPTHSSDGGIHDGMRLDMNLHKKYRKCGGGHASALDHEDEIPSNVRRNPERESHGGESHRSPALAKRKGTLIGRQ